MPAVPRVLCLWDIAHCPEVLDRLKTVTDVDVARPVLAEIAPSIATYDALLTALQLPLDADLIAAATRLKTVVTPSTGLDHLDLVALAKRGIEVQSIKTEYALLDQITATAEHAWSLMLAVARKLPMAHGAALTGMWGRDAFRGTQLNGKTLGIIGVGRLGTMVARYGQAFGMAVLGTDPSPRTRVPGVTYVALETLLARADVVSLHVHLTDETRHLIDAAALAKMKPGAIIINTSRGALIDETALVVALETGKLGGAGLDVIEGEWRSDLADHPLIGLAREHPSVVITPHIGGVTEQSQAMSFQFCADRLAHCLTK